MTLKQLIQHYSVPALYFLMAWAILAEAHPLVHAAICGVLGIVHAVRNRRNDEIKPGPQPPPTAA